MRNLEETSNKINNIIKASNMTVEEAIDFLREYEKNIVEKLAMNARDIENETDLEKIDSLKKEREDLNYLIEASKYCCQKYVDDVKKVAEKIASNGQETKTEEKTETKDAFTEMNEILDRLIEIKEQEKEITAKIVNKCKMMTISDNASDYAPEAQAIDDLNLNISKLLAEEISKINPRLAELVKQITPEQKEQLFKEQKNVISNSPETVSEQYEVIARKIIELDRRIELEKDNDRLCRDYNDVKKALINSVEFLKGTLENPILFKEIKQKVDRKLETEMRIYEQPSQEISNNQEENNNAQINSGNDTNEVNISPIKVSSLNIESDTEENANENKVEGTTPIQPVEPTPIQSAEPTLIQPVEPTPIQQPEPTFVQPVEQPVNNPAKDAYIENYKQLIEMMNKVVSDLNKLIVDETTISIIPDMTAQSREEIIKYEENINRLNNELFDLEMEKSKLELEAFKEQRIMLSKEPSLASLTVDKVEYDANLEQFMSLHNSRIEQAYAQLGKVSQIYEKAVNEDDKAKCEKAEKQLQDFINAEKDIIRRRIVKERQINPSFDVISFIETHRANINQIQPVKAEETKQEEIKTETPSVEPEIDPAIEKEKQKTKFTEKINELCKELALNTIALNGLELSPISQIKEQEEKSQITQKLQQSSEEIKNMFGSYPLLSEEEKKTLFAEAKDKATNETKELSDAQLQDVEGRKQFKELYLELDKLAEECRKKSPNGEMDNGFNEAYISFITKKNEIQDIIGRKKYKEVSNTDTKEFTLSYIYEINGQKVEIKAETICCLGKTKEAVKAEETKEEQPKFSPKVIEIHPTVTFANSTVDGKKAEAIVKKFMGTKLVELKSGFKVSYAKGLKQQLEDAKLTLVENVSGKIIDEQGNVVGEYQSDVPASTMKM